MTSTLDIIGAVVALRDRLTDRGDREILADAANELSTLNERNQQLDYAYRVVDFGFTHKTFDFSVLAQRAAEHVAKALQS